MARSNPGLLLRAALLRAGRCGYMRSLGTVASATLLLAGANLAHAAPAEPQASHGVGALEEITVTARRKVESLQSVPVAVTAVSAEVLEQRVMKAEDLPLVTPGLTVHTSARGNTQPNYTIRGQRGTFDPTPLNDPAVGLYFGEVNLARSQGTNQALYDLASVQVLKGPQGTLFGRNSTGGAILFTPNPPTHDFDMYVKAGAGDYGFRDYEGMLNVPLGDTVALRVGGKSSKRDGYMINVLNGQRANDLDAESYRVSLLLEPSDDLSSTFMGTYYKNDGVGFAPKLNKVDPRGVPLNFGPLRPVAAAALAAELAATNALGKYEFRGRDTRGEQDDVKSIQNNTLWQIGGGQAQGGLTLKNIIAYREVGNVFQLDFVGSGLDVFFNSGHTDEHQFSEELQLQGKTGNLDYVAGLFYFTESGTTFITGRQFGFFPSVVPPTARSFPIYTSYDIDFDWKSYAGFVHGDYDLAGVADGLSVSGGLRWTRDQRDLVYHNISSRGTPRAGYFCDQNQTPVAAFDRELCVVPAKQQTNDELTYDVSLNYQLNPDALLYLAHRKGYRTGGYNPRPLPALANTFVFGPEYVKDLELGGKFEFNVGNMPVRLNSALSYQWYDDVQRSQGVVDPVTGATTNQTLNAAKATILAGEIELTMQPTNNLLLTLGYAYTHGKYDEWVAPYYPAAGVTNYVDISDAEFAMIPQNQWNASATYTLPMGDAGDLALSATAFGVSREATIDNNSANCGADGLYLACYNHGFDLDGYQVLNLRADWRNVGSLGFDVGVFCNNVTDKFYENFAMNVLGLLGTASVGIGPPRMWGVEVKVPFGASSH